jgi:hypothetical protein
MAKARWRPAELPWFVPVLGRPPGSAGLVRLCSHYDLVAVPAGAENPGWYENLELGVSVVMLHDRVDCIIFSADPRHGFGGPHTPCFLGARWGMSREQVRARFGIPDEERGPYPAAGSLAHGGIDRYRSRGLAVAFSYAASGEGLARMDFELPDE